MAKNKQNLNNLRLVVIILMLGLMGVLVYILGGPKVKLEHVQKQPAVNHSATKQDVIDCAKKIDQSEKLALGQTSQSDCLYIGCNDFFQ